MTRKRHSPTAPQPAPYGAQPDRRRGPLHLLIVLYFGWVAFLSALALHDYLR